MIRLEEEQFRKILDNYDLRAEKRDSKIMFYSVFMTLYVALSMSFIAMLPESDALTRLIIILISGGAAFYLARMARNQALEQSDKDEKKP